MSSVLNRNDPHGPESMTELPETLIEETAPSGDQEAAPPRRRRRALAYRALAVVGLYVFSIGPMFWHWYEAEVFGGNPLIRLAYTPLRFLCAIPQVEEWLNDYINWWIA